MPVGELASHSHDCSISTTSLTGSVGDFRRYNDNASGILSATSQTLHYPANGWSDDYMNGRIHINASHTHTVNISSNGNNNAHNNMPPYLGLYVFKRTA